VDPLTFDHLSRTLAASSPRRRVLRLLGAAPIVAGMLAAMGEDGASAASGAGLGGGHAHRRHRRRNRHRHSRNNHPPQQHKECKSPTGRLLSNGDVRDPL
jgi:hypothetical protein